MPPELLFTGRSRLEGPRGGVDALPRVSAERAVQIAGGLLLEELRGSLVPPQDVTFPEGLIRRVQVTPEGRKTSWVVVYRWHAGFDCRNGSGEGPCVVWSRYIVDDQSGEADPFTLVTGG